MQPWSNHTPISSPPPNPTTQALLPNWFLAINALSLPPSHCLGEHHGLGGWKLTAASKLHPPLKMEQPLHPCMPSSPLQTCDLPPKLPPSCLAALAEAGPSHHPISCFSLHRLIWSGQGYLLTLWLLHKYFPSLHWSMQQNKYIMQNKLMIKKIN